MRGHNFNLIAKMRHRSLMGIKKFTSFTGWPVIILLILALIMLGSAFVLGIEGSLLIAWILIFNLGFRSPASTPSTPNMATHTDTLTFTGGAWAEGVALT